MNSSRRASGSPADGANRSVSTPFGRHKTRRAPVTMPLSFGDIVTTQSTFRQASVSKAFHFASCCSSSSRAAPVFGGGGE